MRTLESLRRQIETAMDLESVVTTMKTLAAVSIHQYEQAVDALGEYNRTIELGFRILLKDQSFDLDRHASATKTAAIVFGSNQGMCGQFNEQIVSLLNESKREDDSSEPWSLLAVGTRVEGQLLDSGWSIQQAYDTPSSADDITDLIQVMLPEIERLRTLSGVHRLLVFFNRRTSASSFQSIQHSMLPIDPKRLKRWQKERWDSRSLPSFPTDRRRLLSRLVHQYLFVSLFTACAESLASENASRIAAMQAAEKSIGERLEDLQGAFNQQRQSAITEELLDVVTGFEALSSERKKQAKEASRDSIRR